MSRAMIAFAILGAGVLGLIGWLFSSIFANGAEVDSIALVSVLSLLFRDVISKMGDCVRAMNGQKIPEPTPDADQPKPLGEGSGV